MIERYVFSEEDLVIIKRETEDAKFGGASWGKDELGAIRLSIKHHYIVEQHYECCYCRSELLSDHGRHWDVEHVIPKAKNPEYMFEPLNLAVACIECNQEKGTKPVLTSAFKNFPARSSAYIIVHPHFDSYDEHIEVRGDGLFVAWTDKGSYTIYACNLFRFYQRKARIHKPIRDRRFERDIGELRFQKSSDAAEPLLASIRARLQVEQLRREGQAE